MIPIESSPQKSSVSQCPSCGNNGKAVKTTTLYSLVKKKSQLGKEINYKDYGGFHKGDFVPPLCPKEVRL